MQPSIYIATVGPHRSNVFMALGDNIRAWRQLKGWTTHQLAAEAGIYQASISRYENNEIRPRLDALKKIAKVLGAEVAQLEYGPSSIDVVPVGKRRAPILPFESVVRWLTHQQSIGAEKMNEFILTDAETSERTFAVVVSDEAMSPEFLPGDIIVFDPEVRPRVGDYVFAVDENEQGTFRRFARVGFNKAGAEIIELRPLNTLFDTWNSENLRFRVVGTLLSKTRRYRSVS